MIGNLSSLQQTIGDSTPGLSVSVEDKVKCSSELAYTKLCVVFDFIKVDLIVVDFMKKLIL